MNKKSFLLTVIFLLVLTVLVASYDSSYVKILPASVNVSTNISKSIIIDPGHGGFDGGAVASDGTSEKDINLNISLILGEMLTVSGYEVIYTRIEDTGTEDDNSASIGKRKISDLKNRLKLMEENPHSLYISIHLNKYTSSSANGAQVFYTPNFAEAKDLSISVQNSIISLIQPQNKRTVKKGTTSTYLLKNAKIPAIIVECGFISNNTELELLKTDLYQKQMAFAIYNGIENFYKK